MISKRNFLGVLAAGLIAISSLVIAPPALAETVVATVQTGIDPIGGIAVSPSGSRLYIAGYAQTTNERIVKVIDTATDAVVATVPSGIDPSGGIAVDPSTSRLYIAGLAETTGERIVQILAGTTNNTDFASSVAAPGATVSTNTLVTADDPLGTSVTTPTGGTVSITETAVTETAPTGYQFLGQQVDITSSAATTANNPLTIVFTIDSSVLLAATDMTAPPPDSVDVTRAEAGSPVVIPACTSTSPPISPNPCVSDRRYVGDDLQITILTGSASHWNFAVRTVAADLAVTDSGYNPKTVTVAQGGIVHWTFSGTKLHSATENLKLGPAKAPLFDSGRLTSGRYSYVFRAAATYTYGSTVKGHPGSFAGSVAVPVWISPTTGGTTTAFTVTWSSSTLSGYVFDVQYRFMKAGSKSRSPLKAWRSGAPGASGTFTAPSGAGTYAFSARLRNTTTGMASLWSPETRIAVH